MATHMAQIQDKDSYHELTEKQKLVVDELVDDPFAQNKTIADRAGVSRSTVHNVKEHYPGIIETQINSRGRDPGTERTDGDPFDGQLELKTGAQLIQDRPEQPEDKADTKPEVESDTDTDAREAFVTVALSERDIRAVLAGDDPERVRTAVMDAVVSEAVRGEKAA